MEIGDIRDSDRLSEVMIKYQPKAVIHFAAFAYVGESVNDPSKYYQNNVAGTLILLDAMREYNIHQIVFSSTCATYGIPTTVPITEAVPEHPINPYGHGKLMIERILQDYDRAYNLRSISLRYFNAAGADMEGEIGEDHNPETHLIPLVLQAAAGISPCITVFGDDYDTPDGTCIRDYIHVDDLADAHVKALNSLENGKQTTALNLGTGKGFSIRDVIETARRISQKDVSVVMGERRAGDPPCLVADANEARKQLDWEPAHTQLEPIVSSAWKWLMKDQSNLR